MTQVLSLFNYIFVAGLEIHDYVKVFGNKKRKHATFLNFKFSRFKSLCLKKIWESHSKYQDNCSLVHNYVHSEQTYCSKKQGWNNHEDGGCKFVKKNVLLTRPVSYSTRLQKVLVCLWSNSRFLGHAGWNNRKKC